MDLGLTGKNALVTAASKGLGRSAAEALAREGARLVICARSSQTEITAHQIQTSTGREVVPVRADLTAPDDIERLVERARQRLGTIDILVMNAGGPPPGGFMDLTPEDWQAAAELTLLSAARLCYAVVPDMIERGEGSLVAIQSYSVKKPIEGLILSNSLRMAVIGMLKSMADELGPLGVRVNSIAPALTWTDRVERLIRDRAKRRGSSFEEAVGHAVQGVPLGRMGTVEEFGRAVAWLASPAASFIHGHALMFDGGASRSPL